MMAGQHVENLFRRFKGEKVNLKTISGGLYTGRVIEITNDYVCLNETDGAESQPVFIFFTSIESVAANAVSE
jgi:ribosome maturation factor RimP